MLVLDTASLLYWTMDPAKFTPKAEQAIESANRLVVSAMSIWEIGLKVKKGKLTLPLAFSDYVTDLKTLDKLEIYPVDLEIWLKNLDLPWSHSDPADRTIVATALYLNCPLVSPDHMINHFYTNTLW